MLVDHNLPDGTGIELIRHIRQRDLDSKIVMITAHGNVALAVTAMKAGADDYLTKPVSLEELGLLVNRLLSRSHVEESLAYYRRREEQRSGLDRIIGASPPIVELKCQIAQVLADGSAPVERSAAACADHRRDRDGQGARCTGAAFRGPASRADRSSKSTARRCRRNSSNQNCSGMSAAPSPTPRSGAPV